MRDFAYQAQLVEQECGSDYFGLLQALDTDRWNGCHDTVAALAGAGFVRAVVTTNFDTLTEQALAAERVEHRVHFTPDSLARSSGPIRWWTRSSSGCAASPRTSASR